MKIGLLGGSFNPVHLGHVRMAVAVRDEFLLDEVVIIPSAQPPHKDAAGMAPAHDRLEMTRLAFDAVSGCRVSDIELKRTGLSYTIDTIDFFRRLQADGPGDLLLIMGVDAFLELNTWKDYLTLLQTLPLIVVHRPTSQPDQHRQAMKSFLDAEVSTEYVFSATRACFFHSDLPSIFFFSRICLPESSTEIRQRIMEGRPVNHLLPDGVARVIQKKGLYK